MTSRFEVYRPKKDTRETWIAEMDATDHVLKPSEVSTGRSQASALLGGRKAPIVDFEWAPTMTLLSKPYILSSRGPKKNFDLFADGDWLTKNNPGNDGQPTGLVMVDTLRTLPNDRTAAISMSSI